MFITLPGKNIAVVFLSLLVICVYLPEAAFAYRAQAIALCKEGQELLKLNRLDQAEVKFKQGIEEDITYSENYYYLAVIYERRRQHEMALNELEKAMKNSPHEEKYKYFLCDIRKNMAAEAIKNGDRKAAMKMLAENKSLYPYHLPTYNRLASLYIQDEDWDAAIKESFEAQQQMQQSTVKPDPVEEAILHANLAIAYFMKKNYTKAMEEIRIASRLAPDLEIVKKYENTINSDLNPIIKLTKEADALYDAGDLTGAYEKYLLVLKDAPGYSRAAQRKAEIEKKKKIEELTRTAQNLIASGKLNEASDVVHELLVIDPTNIKGNDMKRDIEHKIELLRKDALKQVAGGKKTETDENRLKDEILKGLVTKEQKADPEIELNRIYEKAKQDYQAGNWDDAIAGFQELIDREGEYKDASKWLRMSYIKKYSLYIYIGLVIFILGTIWYFLGEEIKELVRVDHRKFMKKGSAAMEEGKWEKAIKHFQSALKYEMSPQDALKCKAQIAHCYFSLKNYTEAIKWSTQVLDADPRNNAMHLVLANSYLEQGATNDRAIAEYKWLMKNHKKEDRRLLTILCARFLEENSITSDAVEVYEKCYAMDPSDKRVRKMLCDSYMRSNERSEQALAIYREVVNDEPHRSEVRMMLISALAAAKDYNGVLEHVHELIKRGQIDDSLLNYMVTAYRKLERFEELGKELRAMLAEFGKNYEIKKSIEKILYQEDVAKLIRPDSSAGLTAAGSGPGTQTAPAGGTQPRGPVICKNCAHLNPARVVKCEKCGAPVT